MYQSLGIIVHISISFLTLLPSWRGRVRFVSVSVGGGVGGEASRRKKSRCFHLFFSRLFLQKVTRICLCKIFSICVWDGHLLFDSGILKNRYSCIIKLWSSIEMVWGKSDKDYELIFSAISVLGKTAWYIFLYESRETQNHT